jgi:hypothetical protein
MNIKEAKQQIKQAMTAYFSKDEYGNYEIPIEKQRPVFLIGAPGIGKTAIMEQIAQELGVGLVSYSMTHHTRQSALGLPFIVTKTYGGESFEVSEYTMSEIIATVYDVMETTGVKEGILFLDEINCVSETLAPSMLQFLQYKIFGRHQVPAGWIVVTAGNPPEYNKSVREFDIVTMDRLKKIVVEPDFEVWKEYAYQSWIHAAVLTYLEIKKENFYRVESAVDGKRFVTARGWEDLSQMICIYEKHDLPVDEKLVCQYLQNPDVARDFATYYDLFHKYRADYQIEDILSGTAAPEVKERARRGRFDERLALLGLLIDAITQEIREVLDTQEILGKVLEILKRVKSSIGNERQNDPRNQNQQNSVCSSLHPNESLMDALNCELQRLTGNRDRSRSAHSLSKSQLQSLCCLIDLLQEDIAALTLDDARDFSWLKENLRTRITANQNAAKKASARLSHIFEFCEEAFPHGQELLILVTDLTVNETTARFIAQYGCEKYFEHNKDLLFYERNQEILKNMENMEI